MTSKRIVSLIILVPVAVVLILFIVANRTSVTLTLNPFLTSDSALSFSAPFSLWLILALAIGIIIGGISVWLTQYKYRKALRDSQIEIQQLKTNTGHKTDLVVR